MPGNENRQMANPILHDFSLYSNYHTGFLRFFQKGQFVPSLGYSPPSVSVGGLVPGPLMDTEIRKSPVRYIK